MNGNRWIGVDARDLKKLLSGVHEREQSGERKGMQRALEAVRGVDDGTVLDSREFEGIRKCEASILAAMEECQ